jgi:hypothetical protein
MPNVQQTTPDDGQRSCPKNVVLRQNKFWIICASGSLLKKKSLTTHGNMNVKSFVVVSTYFTDIWLRIEKGEDPL